MELRRILEQDKIAEESLVGDWFAIDPDLQGMNIGIVVWYHIYKRLSSLSWRHIFGIINSPVSLKLVYKFHAVVVADVTLEEAPFKGKKFYLARTDIQ